MLASREVNLSLALQVLDAHAGDVNCLDCSRLKTSLYRAILIDHHENTWTICEAHSQFLSLSLQVLDAHAGDVNCLDWSRLQPNLLLSAGEEGSVKVLRQSWTLNPKPV